MNPQQTFYFIRRNTTDAAQGRDTMIRGTSLNQGQFKVKSKFSILDKKAGMKECDHVETEREQSFLAKY